MHAKNGVCLYFLFEIPSYIIVILFKTSKSSVYILLILKITSEHRQMIFFTISLLMQITYPYRRQV